MEQPEALVIANMLETTARPGWLGEIGAKELRRLHAVNAELLEALTAIVGSAQLNQAAINNNLLDMAHAAITKAEGGL